MNKRRKWIIISNIIITIVFTLILLFSDFYDGALMDYPILVCDFLIILNCSSIIVNIRSKKDLKREEERIENLEIRNQNLKENFDDIRAFRHDFSNIIQSMGGYIKTNDMAGLNNMYESIIEEVEQIKGAQQLNYEIVNNPAVYNLLNSKYKVASDLEIKMDINVLNNISMLNIKDLELCRILGILLDNAIEASKGADEKFVSLTFKYDPVNNRDLVIVKNTYSNKDVDINKIYDNGYTTKKQSKNHGLGLWEVMKIVKRYKNLQIYTAKNKCFMQQLEIYR